jgi:hypothetical protein
MRKRGGKNGFRNRFVQQSPTSELDSVAHHRQNFSAVGQSQSLRPFITPCDGDALIGFDEM